VLLRFTDPQFALNVAERVRRAIEAQSFAYGGREFGITASVGQTTLIGNNVETPRELLEAADAALYEAKAQGRNRTVARVLSSRSHSGRRVSSEDPDATMRGRRTPITGDLEPEPPPASRTARTIEVPLIDAQAIAAEPADPRSIDDKPKKKGRGPRKDPKK
jgi:hypothetical protein